MNTMNMPLWFSNLAFWSAQVSLLVLLAAFLPRVLQIRQPRVLLSYWRALLTICLLLPFVQPWHHVQTAATFAIAPDLADLRPIAPSNPVVTHWHLPSLQIIAQIFGIVILAGIAMRFAILALGLLKLRQFRQASSPISPSSEFTAVLKQMRTQLSARAEFRLSTTVDSPVTFGFASPVILLPERFPSMDAKFQAAIACHELLHVRRHDWAHHLVEETIRAAFWFHPAIGWLIARIRLAREQVVDLEVVRLTKARKPYLQALLEFAVGSACAAAIPAPPFLVERQLAERVALMLKEVHMSRTRLIASLTAIASCLALVITLAARTFPLRGAPRPAHSVPGDSISLQGDPGLPAPILQRIDVNHHDFGDSLNDAVLRDEETRINQLPDRPTVETAIEDAKADRMMKLLVSFWNDRGIEVVVRATLNPSPRSSRYAILVFDVYKQTILPGRLTGGISGGVAQGVSGVGPGSSSGPSAGVSGGVDGPAQVHSSSDTPTVGRDTIWTDTVKKGPMVRQVRGLGTLVPAEDSGNLIARISLPEMMTKEVQPNQNASVGTRKGSVKGHVSSINSEVINGTVSVDIALDASREVGYTAGLQIDGTIDIEKLDNVVQVGRPVHGAANTSGSIFKISNDGKEAVRVNVKFGRSSVNTIEVLDGLKVGDKVILSDVSNWDKVDRIQLK